jgi:hypothetical protein
MGGWATCASFFFMILVMSTNMPYMMRLARIIQMEITTF